VKKNIIISGLVASGLLFSAASPLLATAESSAVNFHQTNSVNESSAKLQKSLDKYVTVINNQYVLSLPQNVKLTRVS